MISTSIGSESACDEAARWNSNLRSTSSFEAALSLLIEFKIAALTIGISAGSGCRVQSPIRTLFRLTIFVFGDAYGRLSLEVMSSKRRRLFFRWFSLEPPPSTSASDRCLLRAVGEAGSGAIEGAGEVNAVEDALLDSGAGRPCTRMGTPFFWLDNILTRGLCDCHYVAVVVCHLVITNVLM